MTKEQIQELKSPEYQKLLKDFAGLNTKGLDLLELQLRKKDPELNASLLIDLLKNRLKAKDKFKLADQMYFSRDGIEQATSENVARYIASELGERKKILDLTAGVGGNAIFFAEKNKVAAIDSDENALACLTENAQAYEVLQNIKTEVVDAETFIDDLDQQEEKYDWVFIDPARREENTRTTSIAESTPNVFDIVETLRDKVANICIKISPAFDYDELNDFIESPKVEIISERNECKVALLWFTNEKQFTRKATVINPDGTTFSLSGEPDEGVLCDESIGKYILEPNKAILKAKLVETFAEQNLSTPVARGSALISSDFIPNLPKYLFRAFEVKHVEKHSEKLLKRFLKEYGYKKANIISRNFFENAEELANKFKIKQDSAKCLIFTKLEDDKPYVFFTEQRI